MADEGAGAPLDELESQCSDLWLMRGQVRHWKNRSSLPIDSCLSLPGPVDSNISLPGSVDSSLSLPGSVDSSLSLPGSVDSSMSARTT